MVLTSPLKSRDVRSERLITALHIFRFLFLFHFTVTADTELEELESLKLVTPGNALIAKQHAAVDAEYGDVGHHLTRDWIFAGFCRDNVPIVCTFFLINHL